MSHHNENLDSELMQAANLLISGQGDGRISNSDMELLLKYDYNTNIKKNTILYIYNNMKLTDGAKDILLEKISIIN